MAIILQYVCILELSLCMWFKTLQFAVEGARSYLRYTNKHTYRQGGNYGWVNTPLGTHVAIERNGLAKVYGHDHEFSPPRLLTTKKVDTYSITSTALQLVSEPTSTLLQIRSRSHFRYFLAQLKRRRFWTISTNRCTPTCHWHSGTQIQSESCNQSHCTKHWLAESCQRMARWKSLLKALGKDPDRQERDLGNGDSKGVGKQQMKPGSASEDGGNPIEIVL